MSIFLLDTPSKEQGIGGDVEACFWVLFYIASELFEWDGPFKNLFKTDALFDEGCVEMRKSSGTFVEIGGSIKRKALEKGHFGNVKFASVPLQTIPAKISSFLATYYDNRQFRDPLIPENPMYGKWGKSRRLANQYREKRATFLKVKKRLVGVSDIIAILDRALQRDDWLEDEDLIDTESNGSVSGQYVGELVGSVELSDNYPLSTVRIGTETSYRSGGISPARHHAVNECVSPATSTTTPPPTVSPPVAGKKRGRAENDEPVAKSEDADVPQMEQETAYEGRLTRLGAKRLRAARGV